MEDSSKYTKKINTIEEFRKLKLGTKFSIYDNVFSFYGVNVGRYPNGDNGRAVVAIEKSGDGYHFPSTVSFFIKKETRKLRYKDVLK